MKEKKKSTVEVIDVQAVINGAGVVYMYFLCQSQVTSQVVVVMFAVYCFLLGCLLLFY